MRLSIKALKNINTDLMRNAIEESDMDTHLVRVYVDQDGSFELDLDIAFFDDDDLVDWDWQIETDSKGEIDESPVLNFQIQKMLNSLLEGVNVHVEEAYADNVEYHESTRDPSTGNPIPNLAKPWVIGDMMISGNLIPSVRSLMKGLKDYAYRSGHQSFFKSREFESLHEALQDLAIQAGNGNLYSEMATIISMSILPSLAYSETAEGLPDLIAGLQSVAEGDYSYDSYNFAIIIDDALQTFQDELTDMR